MALTTHQSSDGTLRVWNNGVLTVKQVKLSKERIAELRKSEFRRANANRIIEGRPAIEDPAVSEIYRGIFKENTSGSVVVEGLGQGGMSFNG